MNTTKVFLTKIFQNVLSYKKGKHNEIRTAETLAKIKVIQEELSRIEGEIRKNLISKYSGDVHYFPFFEKKVYLATGKKVKNINPRQVFKEMNDQNMKLLFPLIVKVLPEKVNEIFNEVYQTQERKKLTKIIKKYTTIGQSDPYIMVNKMSKQELIEHKN